MNRQKKAFTLIELLVVIAIIALLIGILLPALSSARQSAQDIVCKANMRSLSSLNMLYANENREYYSSPVNVGTRYTGRIVVPGEGLQLGTEVLEGNTESITPTTVQDWISPIAGDSVGFSANRAQRTRDIFNNIGCARANVFNDFVFDSGNSGDIDDFDEVAEEGIKQVSYLMPTGFAHVSQDDSAYLRTFIEKGNPRIADISNLMAFSTNTQQPKGFRHRLDRVGTSTSGKIMFSDGTRFWTDADGLDFDAGTNGWMGSFSSSSPLFERSTAYGRTNPNALDTGNNLLLSYRHSEAINTARFDGSVSSMTQADSYRDPNPWYPTGSSWSNNSATQESIIFMENQANGRPNPKIY